MKQISALIFLGLLLSVNAFSQIPDLVPTDGIKHPIHQNNLGKIIFMDGNIPLDQCKESDFLKTHVLNRASNLNFRVFMDNSITNYMHRLAPDLPEEELNQKGNYQFSFFVDGKLIYRENIHHGCGLRKSATTTLRMPFTDTNGGDFWSIYLFDRFKSNGGNKALTDGVHRFRVELRPYVQLQKNSEALVGDLIAAGDLELIIKSEKITAAQIAVQPIAENSGFEKSNERFDENKIKKLNKEIIRQSFKEITSIVVVKDGRLLLEEYFNNADRTTLHDTRSVGKSFTSLLMGMAIQDGYIKSESQTLRDFYDLTKFANYAPEKERVSLKNLLTMSSAFNGSDFNSDSPGNEENMYPSENWVKFALDLPMDSSKANGKQWDYFTAGVVLLGDILHRSTPEGLEKYAHQKLFGPLQISHYQWQYTPQKVVNTAGGLQLTSLDLAKVGQLYQNKGKWHGQQLLPAAWVEKSFTKQFPIPERTNEFYGYLFWNKTYQVNGKNYETFYCAGNGGSKVFVFKDLPLTIVITAKAYNRPYGHAQVDKMMEEYILPAVVR
ncbi:MAG: serine hydrolase [Saprospiraceae bacterium]|nr:serine hydrolase [Saprospiraceae bacterium]